MSDAIILEFKGTVEEYQAVNDELGLDLTTGSGDWPAGLISHTGSVAGGNLVVFEVWDSVASQEAFMASRLGPALGKVGMTEPDRMEWLTVVGHHSV